MAADEIVISIAGRETTVSPLAGWNIGAIVTKGRWQLGCGAVAFEQWEVRDTAGVLLDPQAGPGALDRLFVNEKTGIGA